MADIKIGGRYKTEHTDTPGIPDGGMVVVEAQDAANDRVIVYTVAAEVKTLDLEAGGIVDRPQKQHFSIPSKEFVKDFTKTTAKMRDTKGDVVVEDDEE